MNTSTTAVPQLVTSWRNIALAILAALVSAFQIGKAIIALPLLQAEPLHLSLGETGMVLSALALVGAVLAMPLGLLISRLNARNVLATGLGAMALCSFLGGQANSLSSLLASRFVEGVTVVIVLVCASSVVGRQAAAGDRNLAMALSSTAVPGGIALVILATSFATSLGLAFSWHTLWMINACLAAAAALLIGLGLPSMPAQGQNMAALEAMRSVYASRGAQLIALCFGLYAIIYFAFSGFLPLLLRDLLQLSRSQAGYASAGIVLANVVGNVAAGALMRKGVASARIVFSSFVIAGLCIPALFWLHLPSMAVLVLAVALIGCSGCIPGSLTALAPRVAPSAALVAPTIGFMLQGSYTGQLLGPISAGALSQAGGWSWVAAMLLPVAVMGALLALKLARVEQKG